MASDPLTLFKLLPKTDCGACGRPTCLSFAKELAAARLQLEACPYVAQKCPKCGHVQETFFRKCPKCGLSLQELREMESREAATCPKCGYSSSKRFAECPRCGVSIALISKMARTSVIPAPPRPVQAPQKAQPAKPVKAPPPARPVQPDRTPRPVQPVQSVADMTAAPKSSMDTEAYFKKKRMPTRHCPYCGYTTQEDMAECPQCGQSGEWQIVGG